jgi:ferredoxin
MIWILLLATTGLALASLITINGLTAKITALEKNIKTLDDSIKNTPIILRKKMNRLLVLQKKHAGESFPTVTIQNTGQSVPIIFPWETIFNAAQDDGLGLSGTCEGNGDCGLCGITIISGNENLNPPTPEEETLLKKLEFPAGVRLSCQSRVKGNVVIDFLRK